MRKRQIAADARDPVATLAFAVLGVCGAFGLIPDDWSANKLAEVVGFFMSGLAAVFTLLHHRDFKQALRVGLEIQRATAQPRTISDDETTPIEVGRPDAP